MTTSRAVMATPCPVCHAGPWEPCVVFVAAANAYRIESWSTLHRERVEEAQ